MHALSVSNNWPMWANKSTRKEQIMPSSSPRNPYTIIVGAEASAPLARSAIGGMTMSAVFAMLLVPCMYQLLFSHANNNEVAQ